MLIAIAIGFQHFKLLYNTCIGDDPSQTVHNYSNLFVLLVCGSISLSITIVYTFAYKIKWLNDMLNDESSWLSRIVTRYWEWRLQRTLRNNIERRRAEILM